MIRPLLSLATCGLIRRRKRDTLDMMGMTLDDVCSHVITIGGSGSGKTSILKLLLRDILKRGGKNCGCLWACVKPDEFENARRVIELAGAGTRLVRLRPKEFTYNFLSYEISRPFGSVYSAAALLDELNRLANQASDSGNDPFWTNLFQKMCIAALTVCWLAEREEINVETVYKLVVSSPASFAQASDEKFHERSFCIQMLKKAEAGIRDESERRELTQAASFFMNEAVQLGDKARGAAISQVSSVLSPFLKGDMYSTVCCETSSFSPLDAITGKCVVMDAPVMTYGPAGKFIQALITKQVTQACLARENSRYMTLIVRDELPAITASTEDEVANMALARSTRTAFISGIQSIPTLQESMGGTQGETALHSVLSNYATKLVLSTACPRTAEFFGNAWGDVRDQFVSVSENKDQEDTNLLSMLNDDRLLFSVSEQLVPRCPVQNFLTLRRGGKSNRLLVDAYLSQAGRTYGRDHSPFTLVTFKQI